MATKTFSRDRLRAQLASVSFSQVRKKCGGLRDYHVLCCRNSICNGQQETSPFIWMEHKLFKPKLIHIKLWKQITIIIIIIIWWSLEAFMVVNFRARGINRSARKLARTSTLIKKKKLLLFFSFREQGVATWYIVDVLYLFQWHNDCYIIRDSVCFVSSSKHQRMAAWICSRVLPFVSGTSNATNAMVIALIAA